MAPHRAGTPVIPLLDRTAPRTSQGVVPGSTVPAPRQRPAPRPIEDLSDMEIPTFIRRQMD